VEKHIEEREYGTGDVIHIHEGRFFGVSDMRVRCTSKARLIIIFDKKPTDLIDPETGEISP
jgi:hypothetical protein